MQDPVVVESLRVSWTEGKSVGFIPSSIFIKDESADPKNEKPVYFLQEFGFRHQAWAAIDEHPYPEATLADYYDLINFRGRWERIRYMEGWRPKAPDEEVDPAAVAAMMSVAGLDITFERKEPRFRLVPDWVSVVSHDEHLDLLRKEGQSIEKIRLQCKVRELCGACAAKEKIYGDGWHFFHRRAFAFTLCPADDEHGLLKTKAWAMFSKFAKENYRLLRGHLDRYNKLNSSRKLIRSHSAFLRLVQMGPEAIPFILNDLKKGRIGGIWSAEILAELTGKRGMSPEWWLSWAEQEGYEVGFEA